MFKNKKAMSGWMLLIIVVALIYITSTQRVVVNDKQISTANPNSCKLLGKDYDIINKICAPKINMNITQGN